MKKFLISVLLIGIPALAALPYYLGIKTEESMTEQHKLLAESGFLTVESHQYERGWFGATETTVIRLKPTLLHNTQKYLPDNLKTVLKEPVTMINHIKHGPFSDGLSPIRAKVETEFKYHPETAKVLARFFGGKAPVSITNTVYLGGSGKLSVNVPAFDYEELSGIKLNWKGLSGTTAYNANISNYTHDYTAPAMQVKLADKGTIDLENLHIRTETSVKANQPALGSSSFKLGKFSLQWQEGIDYNVKINELVNLVTDLQIGAFINPTGTIAPSKIMVDKLQFDTQTGGNSEWINSEGRFRFQTLTYGEDRYGPLDINIAGEHLHAPSLTAVKNKLAELSSKAMSEEQIQAEIIKTVKNDASGLFTQNPVFKIKTFHFTMPQGIVDVKGEMRFNGLHQNDLNNLSAMLKKTTVNLDMQVPQKLLEQLAVNQARNIFSVNAEDLAEGRAAMDDINETLRLMVDSTINTMAAEQYLNVNNGNITTRIELADNQLKLNGKAFQAAPEPEFDESDLQPENTNIKPPR